MQEEMDTIVLERMDEVIEGCMGESKPSCVATCPMHTDVKQYVRLIREGKGEEAIRVIREKLFIPGVLGRICAHPCESQCKWKEQESPIAIAALKRYAADYFDDESKWDMTKKATTGKKVAIIGAGPAGGQAALDLVREGHDVTIFDKLQGVGGMMRVGIPEYRLPRTVIDHEYSYLEKLGVTFKLGVEIGKDITLDQLKEAFDAVVVAVGRHVGRVDRSLPHHDVSFAADKFTIRPNGTFECDPLSLQAPQDPQIFFAGDASGESVIVIQAMATGRRVAESVNRYLRGEDLKADRHLEDTKSYETKLKRTIDWSAIVPVDRQHTQSNEEVDKGFTKEEAEREGSRCLQCECRLCMKECMMMPEYAESPKALFESYKETGILEKDPMIAYSCNECSQCTNQCPKDFDLKEIFKALKKTYAKNNEGVAVIDVHKDYDLVQAKECSEDYCVTVGTTVEPKKPKKYLFVPGCTIPNYSPENVENVLKHLRATLDGEVGAMLRCCGKVSLMMGHEEKFKERYQMAQDEIDAVEADVIVTICPSCYKIYSEYGDKPVISYWELMKEQIGLPEGAKGVGKDATLKFNINDPCATRDVTKHHDAIRWLMDEMGYEVEEMNHNRENTRCCGVGGMACSANPGLYERIMERRKGDCTQDQVVTYCGSCRGTFEAMGKDSLHILDLLFKKESYKKEDAKVRAPKDIWENRLETKKRFESYL